ncbi:hypothetical protein [Bradyrhizobium murdochi]|uniref:hypothetical protein n=1 Tax=Bradyrhizobium murdochi TaxID=1038859 RepID=UPI00041EBA24|nr:hypothetical protein [Bradyrhizobium murdochi]
MTEHVTDWLMNIVLVKRHLQVFGMQHQSQSVLANGPDRRADTSLAEILCTHLYSDLGGIAKNEIA